MGKGRKHLTILFSILFVASDILAVNVLPSPDVFRHICMYLYASL